MQCNAYLKKATNIYQKLIILPIEFLKNYAELNFEVKLNISISQNY